MIPKTVGGTLVCLTVLALAPVSDVAAQSADFSGTWRLDESRSNVDVDAPLVGLGGIGSVETLHITQPANGTLVVESSMRQSQARLYLPGGETSNRILLGEPGTLTMSSLWKDGSLVSHGARHYTNGDAPPTEVHETIRLRDEGKSLAIEITLKRAEKTSRSALIFVRETSLGPCESWPSPCKKPMPGPGP